jgi:hypothetical protein
MLPAYNAVEHASVVADIHDVLLQATPSSRDVVALSSLTPKLSPVRGTAALLVCPVLTRLIPLTTTASKLKNNR